MADSEVFEITARELEARTNLNHLESRGTVRLALRTAGLRSQTVSASEMHVVLDRIVPDELEDRGVEESAEVCKSIRACLDQTSIVEPTPTPADLFRRISE